MILSFNWFISTIMKIKCCLSVINTLKNYTNLIEILLKAGWYTQET